MSGAMIIIGPESDHWLCFSLTHSRLVNLIDVTLAHADANSKLVEVVTVADVDAEDQTLSTRLVKILKLKFRQDFETGVCSAC